MKYISAIFHTILDCIIMATIVTLVAIRVAINFFVVNLRNYRGRK